MMTWLKIYLPIYLVLYLMVAFVVPTYRTYRQTGINPITFGKEDNAHDYIGFIMKILIALLFVDVLIYSFSENVYSYLIPISYIKNKSTFFIGFGLIHLALLWISIAQFQMSNSWRIGIDENHKTKLVTNGIFSISRNPIFLGMIVSVFGLFLIMPNAILLCIFVVTYIVIQIQIRLEEDFLSRQFGQEYNHYKSKTRRLI
jgi:protein-S-isoprenylcysteine O-methyltransferase Ste14